jgi:hypothetical protein
MQVVQNEKLVFSVCFSENKTKRTKNACYGRRCDVMQCSVSEYQLKFDFNRHYFAYDIFGLFRILA